MSGVKVGTIDKIEPEGTLTKMTLNVDRDVPVPADAEGAGGYARALSADEQAAQVEVVKRSEAGMVTDPVTCSPDDTLADVDALCSRFRISGLPVTDGDGKLVGIITNRDMRFEVDFDRPVAEVMTKAPLITAQEGVTAEAALGLLRRHKIEKLPIVDGQGRLRGLITVKDFVKTEQFPNATKDRDGRLLVGAAAILAAWFYTGGKRPYGYMGLGEVFVFVFFGLVATLGTAFVQSGVVGLGRGSKAISARDKKKN